MRGCASKASTFPGHFLLRMPTVPIRPAVSGEELLIVDPFHGDALLDLDDCELLFHQHVGDGELDGRAFEPAARSQIVVRTLANLKRLYVRMRSFRQARLVSELLLAIEPGSISELRDRALLAYHLDDFASALRDLESYLRLIRPNPVRDDNHAANASDDQQIREQVRKLHGASLD